MELQLQHKPAAHCENGTISNLLRYLRESGWYADDSIPHFPRFTL